MIPQLSENVKELFRRHNLADDEVSSGADVLLPLAYPFPNLGTYVILMFIPFSAWYLGQDMGFGDQLLFHVSALLSSFVAPIIGIPFLLNVLRIPADMMELFVMSTVYTDRIRVVLGAVHLFSLAAVTLAAVRGVFRLDALKLLRALGISALVMGLSMLAVRGYLAQAVGDQYTGDRDLVQMRWMDRPITAHVFLDGPPPAEPAVAQRGRMEVVATRGTLRVGYIRDSLPWAFRNEQGEVVGMDIELAHKLASDLGVDLELVRLELDDISHYFETGQIDIVMSGLMVSVGRAMTWEFSSPPMDVTLSFLVPDHRRGLFTSLEKLRHEGHLRIGVVHDDDARRRGLDSVLPNAEVVHVPSPRAFLQGLEPDLDAVLYSAEGGSAWTLLYPRYSVAVPGPPVVRAPLGYPLPQGDIRWEHFVSTWVELQRKNGEIDALVRHWIEGGGVRSLEPRWSVIRDVLGWVD